MWTPVNRPASLIMRLGFPALGCRIEWAATALCHCSWLSQERTCLCANDARSVPRANPTFIGPRPDLQLGLLVLLHSAMSRESAASLSGPGSSSQPRLSMALRKIEKAKNLAGQQRFKTRLSAFAERKSFSLWCSKTSIGHTCPPAETGRTPISKRQSSHTPSAGQSSVSPSVVGAAWQPLAPRGVCP